MGNAEYVLKARREYPGDLLNTLGGHARELGDTAGGFADDVLVDTLKQAVHAGPGLAYLVHQLQALHRLREHERRLKGLYVTLRWQCAWVQLNQPARCARHHAIQVNAVTDYVALIV